MPTKVPGVSDIIRNQVFSTTARVRLLGTLPLNGFQVGCYPQMIEVSGPRSLETGELEVMRPSKGTAGRCLLHLYKDT